MDRNIYYHYTTIDGCHSIIRSRRVWLTDYRFLNDKQELRQGLSHFITHLPKEFVSSFKSALDWHENLNHYCVLSLSKSPKILSQWRAYAADGTGVAMGFNAEFLKYSHVDIVECKYQDHEAYAKDLATKYLPFVEMIHQVRSSMGAINEYTAWIREQSEIFQSLITDLIVLKNPAFEEEQEVRAIRTVSLRDAKTRVVGNVIVPFVEAEFWEEDEDTSDMGLVIPEIWLGPKCNELNRTGLWAVYIGMCSIQKYDCGYV